MKVEGREDFFFSEVAEKCSSSPPLLNFWEFNENWLQMNEVQTMAESSVNSCFSSWGQGQSRARPDLLWLHLRSRRKTRSYKADDAYLVLMLLLSSDLLALLAHLQVTG